MRLAKFMFNDDLMDKILIYIPDNTIINGKYRCYFANGGSKVLHEMWFTSESIWQ